MFRVGITAIIIVAVFALVCGCVYYPYTGAYEFRLTPNLNWEPPATAQLPEYAVSGVNQFLLMCLSRGKYIFLEDKSSWMVLDHLDPVLQNWTLGDFVSVTKNTGINTYTLSNESKDLKTNASFLGRTILASTIPGQFKGWNGYSVLQLANGNVLKQIAGDSAIAYTYDPIAVVIDGGGYYLLVVDGVVDWTIVTVIK